MPARKPTSAPSVRRLTFNSLKFLELPRGWKRGDPPPPLPDDFHGHCSITAGNLAKVKLYQPDGNLRALLLSNRVQGDFVVTASYHEKSGAEFFMQSTCSTEEVWLGIQGVGYGAGVDLVRATTVAFVPRDAPSVEAEEFSFRNTYNQQPHERQILEAFGAALAYARGALFNVPVVGEPFDAQHAQSHLAAAAEVKAVIARIDDYAPYTALIGADRVAAAREALQALQGVPLTGSIYTQAASDGHMRAALGLGHVPGGDHAEEQGENSLMPRQRS